MAKKQSDDTSPSFNLLSDYSFNGKLQLSTIDSTSTPFEPLNKLINWINKSEYDI